MRFNRNRWLTASALAALGWSLLACMGSKITTYEATHVAPGETGFCAAASCDAKEKPLLLNGKDVAPPLPHNVQLWQSRGFFPSDTPGTVAAAYKQQGYVWSEDGPSCGCRCFDTKHVAEGGKCLDEAYPGSALYERIHMKGK